MFGSLLIHEEEINIDPKKVGGGQFDLSPFAVFPKICFLEKGVKPCFFFTFDIIISKILPKKFIEIPQVVQKI